MRLAEPRAVPLDRASFARQRRERELRADKLAAEATSPDSIGNALLKVGAYSCYRARVEKGMFERNRAHSDLDIAHTVAAGFVEYARGNSLADDLKAEGAVPHPFDSHPSLAERFQNVGLQFAAQVMADRVVNTEVQTWFSEIAEAERIEHALELDCEKLNYGAWTNSLRWDAITNIVVKNKTLGGRLLAVSFNALKSIDTIEIPLKKLSQPEAEVFEVVGRYYGRGLAAKQHNAATSIASG